MAQISSVVRCTFPQVGQQSGLDMTEAQFGACARGVLGQEDMNRDQPSDETFLFALPMVIRMQREVRAELTLREKTIWEGTHRRVSRTSLSPSRAHLVPHARV